VDPTTAAPALAIAVIADDDIASVAALWQRCGLTRPWNDPAADIALARSGPNATVLVGRDDSRLVASVLVGHDGHRGWVYYVAVDPDCRHKGYGRLIMDAAEGWLRGRGIEKCSSWCAPTTARFRRSINRSAISSSSPSMPSGSTGASRHRNRKSAGTP